MGWCQMGPNEARNGCQRVSASCRAIFVRRRRHDREQQLSSTTRAAQLGRRVAIGREVQVQDRLAVIWVIAFRRHGPIFATLGIRCKVQRFKKVLHL